MGVIIFMVVVYFIYKRVKERLLPYYRSDEVWVNMQVEEMEKKQKEWKKTYIPLLILFTILSPFMFGPLIVIGIFAITSKIGIDMEIKKAKKYQKRAEKDPKLKALISEDFGSTTIEELAKRQLRREGKIIEEEPPKKEKTEWEIIEEFEKKYKEEERRKNQ